MGVTEGLGSGEGNRVGAMVGVGDGYRVVGWFVGLLLTGLRVGKVGERVGRWVG